jgi:hypothetical protein
MTGSVVRSALFVATLLAIGLTLGACQGRSSQPLAPPPAPSAFDAGRPHDGSGRERLDLDAASANDQLVSPEQQGSQPSVRDAAPTADKGSLLGLTRAEVRAVRGRPTLVRGQEWIYTPEQPGCRDVIISEVVGFAGDVVSRVRLERTLTHKVCTRPRF